MDLLNITPNTLYKDCITNPLLKQKIELSEMINDLSEDKLEAVIKIVEIVKKI